MTTQNEPFDYNRSILMDLSEHLKDVPGIDMLVNLPEQESIQDIRVAEILPRVDGEIRGNAERGILCTTNERLMFFLRVPEAASDRPLATATGYLVESLLRRTPLDRERAARYFPKKEAAIIALRKKMAELYFPDLMPVLVLPLAGIAALMGFYDASKQAVVDVEIDLRAEGGRLKKLITVNPQLRLILGPRYEDKPFSDPDEGLPLVAACEASDMIALIERIRDVQSEIDYERLPDELYPTPWAISLLSSSPRAKASLVFKGDDATGKIYLEKGQLMLARKIKKTPMFNVGEVDDLGWNGEASTLTVKGLKIHFNLTGERLSAQFAWIRSYLEELLEVRRSIWEDPFAQVEFEPDAKPDPVGAQLRYHLEPCNDPRVHLKDRLDVEQIDSFMVDFGQLIGPEETVQCLIQLAGTGSNQEGFLFTDRALYARKAGEPGDRIPYQKLPKETETVKKFLSTSLSFGALTFKLDNLGKATVKALMSALKAIAKAASA